MSEPNNVVKFLLKKKLSSEFQPVACGGLFREEWFFEQCLETLSNFVCLIPNLFLPKTPKNYSVGHVGRFWRMRMNPKLG